MTMERRMDSSPGALLARHTARAPLASLVVALALALSTTAAPARAVEGEGPMGGARSAASATSSAPAPNPYAPPPLQIPDALVSDQRGRQVRFVSDLVGKRTVVIALIYTRCQLVCTPVGQNMARLQQALEAAGRKDVRFIFVSRDPERDTPADMRAWGDRFRKGRDWTLVTGAREEVDKLAEALTGGGVGPGDHGPLAWIGDPRSKRWIRANGLGQPEELLRLVEEVGPKRGRR
jgi:protein SCO1